MFEIEYFRLSNKIPPKNKPPRKKYRLYSL